MIEAAQVAAVRLRGCGADPGTPQHGGVDHAAFASTRAVLDDGPAATIERLVRPDRDLYVSIDIDVLEGAMVPATTLPEPGGPAYRQLRELLEAIARRGRIVGFDIVETSAAPAGLAMAMTTAWLVVHFLSASFVDTGKAASAGQGHRPPRGAGEEALDLVRLLDAALCGGAV